MRKIATFKLLKQEGYVYIYIDSITALSSRAFGEHSRIFTTGGDVFDVEDTTANVLSVLGGCLI